MKVKYEYPKIIHFYESIIMLHPDATAEEQKDFFKKNKEILKTFSGEYHAVETWGKRTLAYPINKMKKAIYFHSLFKSEPGSIAELERTMRINEKVIRYMHTRLDDRKPLAKHLEDFKIQLKVSAEREREREAKIQLNIDQV